MAGLKIRMKEDKVKFNNAIVIYIINFIYINRPSLNIVSGLLSIFNIASK